MKALPSFETGGLHTPMLQCHRRIESAFIISPDLAIFQNYGRLIMQKTIKVNLKTVLVKMKEQ
jgi:hypothetical protein